MEFFQRLAGRATTDSISLGDIERGDRPNRTLERLAPAASNMHRTQAINDPLGVHESRPPKLGSPIHLQTKGDKRERDEYADRTKKVRIIELGNRAAAEEMEVMAEEYQTRIDSLEKNLAEATSRNSELEALVADSKHKAQIDMSTEIEKYKTTIAKLESAATEGNKKLSELQRTTEDAAKMAKAMETDALEKNDIIQKYAARIDELEKCAVKGNQKVSQLEKLSANATQNLDQAKIEVSSRDMTIKEYIAKIVELEAGASEASKRVAHLEAGRADMEKKLTQAGVNFAKVAELEKELADAELKFVEESNQALRTSEAEIVRVRAEILQEHQTQIYEMSTGFDRRLAQVVGDTKQHFQTIIDQCRVEVTGLQQKIQEREESSQKHLEMLKEAERQGEKHRLAFEREQSRRVEVERRLTETGSRGNPENLPAVSVNRQSNYHEPDHHDTPEPKKSSKDIGEDNHMDEEEDIALDEDVDMDEAEKRAEKRRGKQSARMPTDETPTRRDVDDDNVDENEGFDEFDGVHGRKTTIPKPQRIKHPRGGQGPQTRINVPAVPSSRSSSRSATPQTTPSRLPNRRPRYRPSIDVDDLFGKPTVRRPEGAEDRARGITDRPSKRLAVYQQSKLRGSDLPHAEKLDMVRTRLNELIGISQTKDIVNINLPEDDEVEEFAYGDREAPLLTPHRPFFGELWLKCKWNLHLAELFVDNFADHYEVDLDDDGRDDVAMMYTNRLETLRRKWKSLTRDVSDEELEDTKIERRKAMGKRNTRRVTLFDIRREICSNSLLTRDGSEDSGWKAHLNLVLALGPGGMSSDESDLEGDGAMRRPVYRIRKRKWRSREVTDCLKFIDGHRNTTNGHGSIRPGNPMRERIRSSTNNSSTRDPVIRCPKNFYDEGFVSNLSNLHYRALFMSKATPLAKVRQ